MINPRHLGIGLHRGDDARILLAGDRPGGCTSRARNRRNVFR